MTENHYRRTTCRLCNGGELDLRVPFGFSPIGGAFVPAERVHHTQDLYPLDLYQCRACGHVQLLDVVSPKLLFQDGYSYLSGRTSLVEHFANYADRVVAGSRLEKGFVVDIGSNDGSFLTFFRDRGFKILGVDPAADAAEVAAASGVPTLPVAFDEAVAGRIRRNHGPADVITANNVFAHVDDMEGMARGIQTLLADGGLFYFEVSYLLDVVDKMLLGTIFHEHLCYHTVKPLASFLKRAGMELVDVVRVPIQGGSIIGTARRLGGTRQAAPSVADLIALEESRGVYREGFFESFCRRLDEVKSALQHLIADITSRGQEIAAYGAARGGTFLTYLFDFGRHLQYIVDDDTLKIGTFSPGWHIPVLPVSTLYERRPDYVVVLAWVHSKAIVQKNRRYLDGGGKFITFFPSIRVIDKDTAWA